MERAEHQVVIVVVAGYGTLVEDPRDLSRQLYLAIKSLLHHSCFLDAHEAGLLSSVHFLLRVNLPEPHASQQELVVALRLHDDLRRQILDRLEVLVQRFLLFIDSLDRVTGCNLDGLLHCPVCEVPIHS